MAEESIQRSYKLNPKDVEEQLANSKSGSDSNSGSMFSDESDKAMQEKYGGVIGATIATGAENFIDHKKEEISNGINVGKKLLNAYEKAEEFQQLSPEEQVAQLEREQKDAQDEKDAEAKAEQAEKDRLENLKKQYIVNGAMIECSCSPNRSFLVIPVSHGQYINDIAQLNVGDCMPDVNIISFKVCQSPSNPSVQEAAQKVLEKAQDRKKGFFDRVMDLFGAPKEVGKIDDELLKQCAGACKCTIDGDLKWIDGEETVIVDGKPALLGRCTTMCTFGGSIKFYTCGQEK
ncbi:DUF4280 domain-containing protein [Clostridium beijerinckii]|uniref:DUF4280 domain-containing protein n=1 Tax=Clostridium beijerinckii TaxID=1520 RepID=UPI00098C9F12|nr:DUF4280 domain-containing protein [Clostridium beijerinckii]MBA8932920.1 hypothetical protein [Clostridium beijerinckii]NOW06108.1 hypothetical protein [Clostridium beijerinckii]NRU37123.1 hypothetical protein [Clostridium beijerinckii]NSA99598.1 hypothetical protein [Clostridium beijerinckii]NYC00748.1 hypothetical protein [Clostridium beijerinckii]